MDLNSSDLEFFDFKNATEEEIKEIHSILKGPECNGYIELPWEIPRKLNSVQEPPALNEGNAEETESVSVIQPIKKVKSVPEAEPPIVTSHVPLLPPVVPLHPPPVETYAAIPTTVGSYPSPPYLVSRTIPYLRAYPHMGVPFFACPIQPEYGQYVPVMPEKFAGQIETQPNPKTEDRSPLTRRNKKKSETFEGESEPLTSSDRPTTLPIVPLSPSTFAVAGGSLPMHGYPPGLHTLPYKQLTGPIAPSTAMYYVPLFNHPYGSYMPSPPSAPVMLPVNLRQEVEMEPLANRCNKPPDLDTEMLENVCEPPDLGNEVPEKPPEEPLGLGTEVPESIVVLTNLENEVPQNDAVCNDGANSSDDFEKSPEPTVTSTLPEKVVETDCNSCSGVSNTLSPPVDCRTLVEEDNSTVEEVNTDPSRRWADLFRKPSSEVNGIEHGKDLSFNKKDITNGKVYSAPTKNSVRACKE